MMKENDSLPSKEGLKEAIKRLRELREKKPSDELIQIIKDVTEINYPDHVKKVDIAAGGENPKNQDIEA